MASIFLKTSSGVDFPIINEKGIVIKTISLKGNALINTVSDVQLKELRANGLASYEDKGYAIVNGKADYDDVLQKAKDKEDIDIKSNEKQNNVKITKK